MKPPMPQAITSAIDTTWVLSDHRSRSSLRSRRLHQEISAGVSLRAGLLLADDAPVAQAQHAVGHAGDGGVVRDHHRGGAELGVDPRDHLEHQLAGLVVERAGGLVAQQHVGALGDGARDGDALLLAAGELRGEVVEPLAQADPARAPRPGAWGSSAMSVTSATFSRAVRLGMRL